MKGKMANFTQLESFFIKRILKAILKIKHLSAVSVTYTVSCGLDFPVLGV